MNKKKPQNLIEQENRFQKLFETMNLGVTYQNSKGEIIDANNAATRILGLSLDQMQGKTSLDPNWKAIHEDGSDYTGDTHPSMLALKTCKPVLNKVMGVVNANDNDYRWIKIDAIPQFRNGEKKPYQVYTTFDNITLLKKSEFLLKENEKRYVKAQEVGKVGNWEYDIQKDHLWGSDETFKIFGLDPKIHHLTFNLIESCVIEAAREFVSDAMVNLIENEKVYNIEYEINPKNNDSPKIVNSKAELVYNKQGKLLKVVGVIQDITKRYKTENKLKESEDKFFKVFKNSSNAIILSRLSNYEIINSNNATFKITGYSTEELKGLKMSELDIWKSKNDYKKYIKQIVKNRRVKDYETHFITKFGETRIWQVSGEIIQIEKEEFLLSIIIDVTEIRKTEEELKRQTDFTIAMTENQPAGIVACNAQGKLVLFNKTAKDWHGIDIMKIPQEKWAENYGLYKADLKTLLKTDEIPLLKAFNGEKIVNLEMIIKAKNQEPRFVICNCASFFDSLGNKLGALAVMNDITHQKLVESNLKKALLKIERSEFFLKESAKIAKIGGWGIDLNSQKVTWSEQVFKIHGLPVGKMPSLEEAMSFFINGSKEILSNTIEESIAKNKKYDLELQFKNALNENLWVNTIGYPITNKTGEVIGLRGVFQDITEQKLIREKIEKTQEMHSLLANNTSDLICLQNPNGTFRYISPSIKSLLGYEQSDFLGKQIFSIVHKDDIQTLRHAMYGKQFNIKSSQTFTFRILHKKGHFIWLEFLTSPVYKDGKINYYVTSARDITQSVLAKEEIEEYQKSLQKLTNEITIIEEKQKKQIASNIHDHLSQCLVISKMKIKELKKNSGLNEFHEDLKFIEKHIADALENSRKITYELSPPVLYQLGIIDALHWLLENLENTHKIKFKLHSNVSTIKLTELKSILLYRSIQEVLTNSIKHAKASQIDLNIEKSKQEIHISIVDNGVGFNTEVLNKSKNHSGSGFGLFAVKERIRNIQGEFTIASKINIGTNTKILIPLF